MIRTKPLDSAVIETNDGTMSDSPPTASSLNLTSHSARSGIARSFNPAVRWFEYWIIGVISTTTVVLSPCLASAQSTDIEAPSRQTLDSETIGEHQSWFEHLPLLTWTALPPLNTHSGLQDGNDWFPVGLQSVEDSEEEVPPPPMPVDSQLVVPPVDNEVSLPTRLTFEGMSDPRYTSSRLSSFVVSCKRCGDPCCRCVYAPFGDSVHAAFSHQIHRGSAELMTLYNYDFRQLGSSHPEELTARGRYQLNKIIRRMQFTPAPIKIQSSGDQTVDLNRRSKIVESLKGFDVGADRVIVVQRVSEQSASEKAISGSNLLRIIQARGRTIETGQSGSFSGVVELSR